MKYITWILLCVIFIVCLLTYFEFFSKDFEKFMRFYGYHTVGLFSFLILLFKFTQQHIKSEKMNKILIFEICFIFFGVTSIDEFIQILSRNFDVIDILYNALGTGLAFIYVLYVLPIETLQQKNEDSIM